MVVDRLYQPPVTNNKGDFWPGNDFHPLRVIHVGQATFTDNKGVWRPRQESLELIRHHVTNGLINISESDLIELLTGRAPLKEDFVVPIESGSYILKSGDLLVPVWVAARVSLMIDDREKEILRMKLGFEWEEEE